MASTKQYRARVHLGATTDTYDAEGSILEERDASGITREQVEAVLPQFIGAIDQLPPMYSAIKQDGKKLYDLARAGRTVEREPRRVQIDQLTITDWEPPEFSLEVTCGAGTYIRSLAFDIGEALGVGAYLNGLVRTVSGRFTLAEAHPLESLTNQAEWIAALISPAAAMSGWPVAVVNDAGRLRLQQGGFAPVQQDAVNDTLALVYTDDSQAELLGLVRAVDGVWRPEKIFSR
jgi:tRNA pseudouridine55 synthase